MWIKYRRSTAATKLKVSVFIHNVKKITFEFKENKCKFLTVCLTVGKIISFI